MIQPVNLRDLTNGERLLIDRRRSNQTQRDAAEEHGVTLYCYRRWETDEYDDAPQVALHNLESYERCFLLRKRSGISLNDLSEAIGVCSWWLCKMEHGKENADRLIRHWAVIEKPWRRSIRPSLQEAKA